MQEQEKRLRDEIENSIRTAFDLSTDIVRSHEVSNTFISEHDGLIREVAYTLGVRMVRRLIQERMKSCADTTDVPEQIPLLADLKGLPQAFSYEELGGVVYIARRNSRREHSQKQLAYLRKLISADTVKANQVEAYHTRMERLRAVYGDLPESELLARASREVA